VIKEATALHDAGYRVEVLGGWFVPEFKARDQELMTNVEFQYRPLCDLTENTALRLWLRARGRLAKAIHAKTGWESHWQLGYAVSALRRAAKNGKADLWIAHADQGLWAVANGSVAKVPFGFDMEDWLSEDTAPEMRRHRPVKLLRNLEHDVLRSAAHTTCPSRAMSDALAAEYDCRPPEVIYNAFPWSDRATIDGQIKDRRDRSLPSIHWYSQTLGSDRGLGDLFAALPRIDRDVEVHLRGKPAAGFQEWMAAHLPKAHRNRIFIHGQVSNDELLSRIAEHDIGFCGELQFCCNRDLTVTNKILHYLLAGLAVVASDTAGQREVAEKAKDAVRIYASGNPVTLATQLNLLLCKPELLRESKAAALHVAERTFCWERAAPILLRSVELALTKTSSHP
jgi:glycosyltransferase involved in cell wall biosynthesis